MTEEHLEDLPGYALGVLDAEEQLQAEQHVAECLECHKEAVQVTEVLHTVLGESVQLHRPSPLLRTQFLARMALEMGPAALREVPGRPATPVPPLVVQQTPPTSSMPAQLGAQLRPMPYWMVGAMAVPAVLALLFGVFFFNMKSQVDDLRGHPFSAAIEGSHTIMPLSGSATRQGATGELIVPANSTSGLLIVSGLPTAPRDMAYTCWLRRGGLWVSAGYLRPDLSGVAMMVLDRGRNLRNAESVGITMEHMNHPTSQPAEPMLLSTRI